MIVTTFLRSDLLPLRCRKCGTLISGDDDGDGEDVAFVCPVCGLVHEVVDGDIGVTVSLVCSSTTRLAVTGDLHHLAVWRLAVEVDEPGDSTWEQITSRAPTGLPYLYVPAFSSARSVAHRLGLRLTEAQPALETAGHGRLPTQAPSLREAGLQVPPETRSPAPHLAAVPATDRGLGDDRSGDDPADIGGDASGLGLFSPVLLGRPDARVLSRFIYLSLRSGDTRDLGVVDYRVDVLSEELVYIPAVWDERCIHDAGWRLLLSEFDGLVA